MRILIVEDEAFIALDMQAALTDAGCEVVGVASSVESALRMLTGKKCDAAVLDANLHGRDTGPVAEALRARGIPFVIVSGYQGAMLAGALAGAPLISKPYNVSAFVTAVQGLAKSAGKVRATA
jgi:DNA-binding response OmpR family regulator